MSVEENQSAGSGQLDRKLSLTGLTLIVIGACIGSGIFATPNVVLKAVPHHGVAILVWLAGGVITLTGALTFAELGGIFPRAGGIYVYLREAYGRLTAFLYGWISLLVINSGALAALSLVFASYLQFFIPGITDYGKIVVGVTIITLLTIWNVFSVGVVQTLAKVFTSFKLLALAVIILIGGLYFQPGSIQLLEEPTTTDIHWTTAVFTALIGVFFSLSGWHHVSYLSGEAKDAVRTVPRAMILGTVAVITVYVLVNLAYFVMLPIPEMIVSEAVAGDALSTVFPSGGQVAAAIIAISIFGSIAIITMSAPRIYYAMAAEGLFFKPLAKVHPQYHTPINAMVIQSIWAIFLLVFWGTFSSLMSFMVFMEIAFMVLAAASIFLFRRRLPERERPYRTWGYPWIPSIYILVCSVFVLNTLFQQPTQALAGLGVLAGGIVVFLIFNRNQT